MSAAVTGNDSQPCFRQTKTCVRRCQSNVTSKRQLATTAHSQAVYCRNHRHRTFARSDRKESVLALKCSVLQLRLPSADSPMSVPTQNALSPAPVRITARKLESAGKPRNRSLSDRHFAGQRVEFLRTVEPHKCDTVLSLLFKLKTFVYFVTLTQGCIPPLRRQDAKTQRRETHAKGGYMLTAISTRIFSSSFSDLAALAIHDLAVNVNSEPETQNPNPKRLGEFHRNRILRIAIVIKALP